MRNRTTLASLIWAALALDPLGGHATEQEDPAGAGRQTEHSNENRKVCHHPRQTHCWKTVFEEDFENTRLPALRWAADTYPDTVFSDNGSFFQKQGIAPPANAWRASASFGARHWLTVESYSLSLDTSPHSLLAITDDPSGAHNKVLRLASPAHTDATVIRSTQPLPRQYRISLRVGYADFGNGKGLNGYDGGESAGPWQVGRDADATVENGFYWLSILDSVPRPHNNVWIHHHRKVTLDSDNNVQPWTEIYDGKSFILNGEMPLMMFALDGRGPVTEYGGKPLIPYSAGTWQPSATIRAVDSYKPMRWYRASIERDGDVFTLHVSGDFKYGGPHASYTAVMDAAARCIWHYNQTPLASDSDCVDNGHYPSLPTESALWPAGSAWPDYFMFGDPHNNFYEGKVYYDDIRMEVWQE